MVGPAGQAPREHTRRTGRWPSSARASRPPNTFEVPLASSDPGSGRDLTATRAGSKLEGLPRRVAERRLVGVRPLLENSTACQKSMPIFILVRGGWLGACRWWWVSGSSRTVPLVEMDDSLRVHSYSQIIVPFGVRSSQMSAPSVGPSGLPVSCWSSTESLILAQDERWRRA